MSALAVNEQGPAGNDVDELHVLLDFAPGTLRRLAERIEQSNADMLQVYRENELDEVWRWVDAALMQARARDPLSSDSAGLEHLRREVMAAHDLVGNDADLCAAAMRLRALADLCSAQQAHTATPAAA